ncbi:MAG: alpha/beta hydrolase [Methylococcales bacterium]|nr:alpha/beta hydrolase [Methylococcales bacterium]
MRTSTVYFATNRKPNRKSHPTSFGKGFTEKGFGDLRFGSAEVVDGRLNEDSIAVLPDNPSEGSQKLLCDLKGSMLHSHTDCIIFVHGFNVSFEEAIEDAAKVSECYAKVSNGAYKPNIFVFSWPSDGRATRYANDRADAEATGYAFARGMLKLAEFLSSVKRGEECQQKIHLIAHSMGNYVLRYCLQQAAKIGERSLSRIFDNIILVAADEDNDAFEFDYKLAKLTELAQRITVYFNSDDLALSISDFVKGNPDRLGHDGPNKPNDLAAKIVLVDASDVVSGITEHSYYVEEVVVARDIVSVLQGESSEEIIGRKYVPHANKFKLYNPATHNLKGTT